MTTNEIWVLSEVRDSRLTQVTLQLLGAARQLAQPGHFGVVAILLGGEKHHADELSQRAEAVLWVTDPRLEPYDSKKHFEALSHLVENRQTPAAILAGASTRSQELLPRLAVLLNCGYASSVLKIWWENSTLCARRPIYGGKAYEEFAFISKPAVATVRSGAFPVQEKLAKPGQIITPEIRLAESAGPALVERRPTSSGHRDIAEASRVIAGGRGMGSAENFRLLEELADALDAAVGASRSVVDAGWRPHDEQVGKSGKTISPDLYMACGISGAIHHILGMNTSKVVVAINSDPAALIFQHADLGLVGDVKMVIPALTTAIKEMVAKKGN